MGKTSCKKGEYYCNTDKKCKPIPDGYEVREDGFLVKEGWSDKYKKSIDCDNPKGFSQKAHCQGKKKMKETYERSLVPLSEKAKKCWPGYEKKGTKKMFGKTYNNCVKKEEVEHEVNENAAALKLAGKGVQKAIPALMTGIGAAGTILQQRKFDQEKYEPAPNAEIYDDNPKRNIPVTQADSGQGNPRVGKVKTYKVDPKTLKDNPTGKVKKEHYDWRAELDEDWQKTNRQDKTDGMSKAAVKAYRRENPGSKLKTAVTKKPSSLKRGSKDAKRRKSFCSRMKGMKKRLTSAKTARDPDSRINKALRRWNC